MRNEVVDALLQSGWRELPGPISEHWLRFSDDSILELRIQSDDGVLAILYGGETVHKDEDTPDRRRRLVVAANICARITSGTIGECATRTIGGTMADAVAGACEAMEMWGA